MLGFLNAHTVQFLVFGALLAANSWARVIVPLADARKSLAVPEYSSEERETLLSQADLSLRQLFVHRDLKLVDFGASSDPLPKLDALKEKLNQLTGSELNEKLAATFTELHDLHTNYMAPRPLSCGLAFVPLRFAQVKDGDKDIVVVSQKLGVKAELVSDVTVGDELTQVDSVDTLKLIKSMQSLSAGSNPDAIAFRAVQLLSFRALSMNPIPTEDSRNFSFKRADGTTYEKAIPWQALLDEQCIAASANNVDAPPVTTKSRRPKSELLNRAEDEFQKKFLKIYGNPSLVTPIRRWATNPAVSEVFEVALLNTPAGKIGYVQLKAFYWDDESLDTGTVIENFRRAVEDTFAGAIGIVVDVRGNPGGLIVLAEKLVQLFSPKEVQPTTVRMLANELNEEIFVQANGKENRWSHAIRQAIDAKNKYTAPLAITPTSEANSFGQIWFKPVVVLTDAACYSACDLFSAGMQDNGAGVVIGLHKTTGGGGANVMEHATFRAIMAQSENNPFKALPFGQNMRVAWRQSVRAGKNDGKFIEDAGIVSDFIVPLKKADVGLESKELMKQVHRIVDELQPKYTSGLGVKNGGLVLLENGTEAAWKEMPYGVDQIEVRLGTKTVSTIPVPLSTSASEVEVRIKGLSREWQDQPVLLIGKKNNRQVFRSIRELKWRGEYTPVSTDKAVEVNFDTDKNDPLKTVLLKGTNQAGWQIVDGKLRIGKGPKYEPRVLARAFFPLQLNEEGGFMKLDLSLKAEELHDSLRIYYLNPDSGERFEVFAGSDVGPLTGTRVRLPADWKRTDVVFEFESDENWNLEGPVLDNLKFSKD